MLTDTKLKQAKPQDRPYKLADSGGLYLYVSTRGGKSWRYDFRLAGRRHTLVIGPYPEITLADAREKHHEARKQVTAGINPAASKQTAKQEQAQSAGNTFRGLAESWYDKKAPHHSPNWARTVRCWLDQDILPAFGDRPVKDIVPADVLALIQCIEKRGAKVTAEKIRSLVSQIFRHASRNLRATFDPAQALCGVITLPKVKHHPALEQKELPAFLTALGYYPVMQTRLALQLLLLTFVRKQELAHALWEEIDLEACEWRIPAERMKGRRPHFVPLSSQARDILEQLQLLAGNSPYVLPHRSSIRQPMNPGRFNDAIRILGYAGRLTPHGFRAMASTILNEAGFDPDAIERQLAHVELNKVRAAYHRSEYRDERKRMMQWWGDYLDGLATDAKVIPFRQTA